MRSKLVFLFRVVMAPECRGRAPPRKDRFPGFVQGRPDCRYHECANAGERAAVPTTSSERKTRGRAYVLTSLAMLAFAGNSLLCRQALGRGLIDAASFTAVRLLSGAIMLAAVFVLRGRWTAGQRDWRAVTALFAYMALFSFAYLSLGAGTGALILFGAVQLTMFTAALYRGESFPAASWIGLAIAISGLAYLVAPGVTAPDPLGAVLMAAAGSAWGAYSLLGRSATDPVSATASNFVLAAPIAVLLLLPFIKTLSVTGAGLWLAAASGALTSALGYVTWYAALRYLSATSAATVQLSVPAIAAMGGVALLDEDPTLRLVAASVATLGGVAIVLLTRGNGRGQISKRNRK